MEIRLNVAPVSTKSFAATPHSSMSMNRLASNPTELAPMEGFFTCLNASSLRLCSALLFIPSLVTRGLCIVSKLSILMRLMLNSFGAYALVYDKNSKILRFQIQCSFLYASIAQSLQLFLP